MDAAQGVGSHENGVEGDNHLSWPVGHTPIHASQDASQPILASLCLNREKHLPSPDGSALLNVVQDTVSSLCYQGTLLTHIQLSIHQDS